MKNTLNALKIALLTPTVCLLFLSSKAQVIQDVQNSFNHYGQAALQEKIFVHTDKNVYLPGELVWFKVYCVDGNDNRLLNLSKVAYVEVLDDNQAPIIQAKVALKNGLGDGSLYIPVTVSNGHYRFRAYTNWMKNFSPDYYFEKTITLVNPLKTPELSVKEKSPAYDVRFFPEGGNLVSGINSKVGFKGTGSDGKGINFTGFVFNQHNDTVARFKSLKFGMGNFSFTPVSGDTYKAVIKVGGTVINETLPEISARGYVMKVSDNAGSVSVDVSGPDGPAYIFAHTRQTMKIAETIKISGGTGHFAFNKSALSDGISSITVFDADKHPVCERLYFKRPAQQLFIDAGSDQPQYALRKKINLNIAAKDNIGKPANANMSVAVYRIDSLQHADYTNIFDYLWLGSDLKGAIESPNYYFKNITAETDQALDNLMLTQGWRRFDWSDVLSNKKPAFTYMPEYYGHIINAKAVNIKSNAPVPNIIAYLGVPGKRVQVYTAMSDSTGHLYFNTKDFYSAGEIVAQPNTLTDTTDRIDIISPFSEQYSKVPLPKYEFKDGSQSDLRTHSLGIQVLNIYSGNNIKRFYDTGIDSSAFYGKPYKTYKLDDFTRFTTMEEDLREYVTEDNIVLSKGRFHIKVLNERGFLDGDPLVILDGVPIFDINKIFAVDPLKVRKLEVIHDRFYYGPTSNEGIFSFTTYKGDLAGTELDPHAVVVDYEGMQLHRQFYSPVYDDETKSATRVPDFRNVLYWAPSVNAQGSLSFYSSDQPGKYIGVVQGITPDGHAASQYFSFEVR